MQRGLNLCRHLFDIGLDEGFEPSTVSQQSFSFSARRTIFHQDENIDGVPILCDGWAAATYRLSNGRHQILSFLLPGEMMSCRLIFDPHMHVWISGITDGHYRTFDRAQLRNAMTSSEKTFDRYIAAYNVESTRANRTIVALGQRTAAERVAGLIADLWSRLEDLHRVHGNSVEFPLRHSHIAEATGLTPVYVNTVLREFRQAGIVRISDRSLEVLDMSRLRRLAN